jgi:hypothetical protein
MTKVSTQYALLQRGRHSDTAAFVQKEGLGQEKAHALPLWSCASTKTALSPHDTEIIF